MDKLELNIAMKLLEMALSSAEPALPLEGTMPTSSSLFPKESAVYCTPLSVLWTRSAAGFLLHVAIEENGIYSIKTLCYFVGGRHHTRVGEEEQREERDE